MEVQTFLNLFMVVVTISVVVFFFVAFHGTSQREAEELKNIEEYQQQFLCRKRVLIEELLVELQQQTVGERMTTKELSRRLCNLLFVHKEI